VLVQLPWNTAFTVQSWMGVPIGSAAATIQVVADAAEITEGSGGGHGRRSSAGLATRALLQGDVDTAIESLELRRVHRPPVVLSVPLRITGATHDEFLVVDHADFSLVDAHGTVLYRGTGKTRHSVALIPDADRPDVALQRFEVPQEVYRRIGSRAVSLVADYSLTIRAVVAQHRIPAIAGEIRSPEIGVCQSGADPTAAYIRCKQIGHAPNCYAATLYGPDGRHNPQVQSCGSDYRPFIPAITNILSFNGIDLPIRDNYGVAHYDVDGSDLSDSYVILKVYETGEHFRRTVVSRLQSTVH
jgi:hypothetical protein